MPLAPTPNANTRIRGECDPGTTKKSPPGLISVYNSG